jgi:hypothetical protein
MVAAPLSNDELAGRADLIVEAQVLHRSGGRATINLKRVIKGKPHLHQRGWLYRLGLKRTVIVSYRSQPQKPVPGDWWNEDAFSRGNCIRAYLIWDDGSESYESIWWNAIEVLS